MLGKVRYRKHTKYVILYKENLEMDHKKEQNLKENKTFPHCVTSVYITIPFFWPVLNQVSSLLFKKKQRTCNGGSSTVAKLTSWSLPKLIHVEPSTVTDPDVVFP